MVKILQLVSAELGFLSIIMYCTGRWYKQHYFSALGVPWEILEFETTYFLFGGWFTILMAASFAILILELCSSVLAGRLTLIVLCSLAVIIALAFGAAAACGKIVKGDWWFIITCLSGSIPPLILEAFGKMPYLMAYKLVKFPSGLSQAAFLLVVCLFSIFIICFAAAFAVGNIHAQIAIKRGWLEVVSISNDVHLPKEAPKWYFVTRMEKDRNVIRAVSDSAVYVAIVPDSAIQHLKSH